MRRDWKSVGIALLVSAMVFPATRVHALDVGDSVPALKIKEWVRGSAIDLAKDSAKKVHIVEFWATWCPPCKMTIPILTDFQKKYEKDLVVVGVTDEDDRGNTASAIRRFVKEQGEKMNYTVAIDDRGATTSAYLAAAGAIGLPHAFLVGRDGKILWQGNPMDPDLGDLIPQVIEGSYSASSARLEREVAKKLQALSMSIEAQQWGTVWDGLVEVLKIDPANEVAMQALASVYSEELHNTATYRSWVRGHIDAYKTNVTAMRRLAETLLATREVGRRMPEFSLEAAKAAYESSKRADAGAVAVYARARYQIGDLDRAISLQQEAIAAASEKDRKESQQALDYYKKCKQLRETVE